MEQVRFEVFDGEAVTPRLRFFDVGVKTPVERMLNRAEVDALVDRVEAGYGVLAADLVGIGQDLFRWLDGPTERWLATALDRRQPLVVNVDCGERLRHLPWELMHDGTGFISVQANVMAVPVRAVTLRASKPAGPANRPLRVLFMACSAEGVQPVLSFEQEEALILQAAAGSIDVVVEESGSLAGLAEIAARFGNGYFDVLHLTGHATATPAGPRFVMENEIGLRDEVTAAQIADAVGGRWPAIVFLSGCHTGRSFADGEVSSMAEALVDAGAPAVLGWALPVGDRAANELAAALYKELASGTARDAAIAAARRTLFAANNPFWHLLRLYTDSSPATALVTPKGEKGREKLRRRKTTGLFLDASQTVKVASHESFVGRRRSLQRCLHELRPADSADGAQVVVLHGMGGLGKSSLAARLLDRLRPTHPHHAVWVGKIDELSISSLTERITLTNADAQQSVRDLLERPGMALADRLRFVLDGPLANEACVFVFDDFENGNLDDDGNRGKVCTPDALAVLTAFATAIKTTASPSRVVVTSRYTFPLPSGVTAFHEPLMALRDADLTKKFRDSTNLSDNSTLDPSVREIAIDASAGVPRLIERIDQIISDTETDHAAIVHAIADTEVAYREELLLTKLLDAQSPDTRRLLALAAIYDIPVPIEALAALTPDTDIAVALGRAVAVGLIDKGLEPESQQARYLVSTLVKPLLKDIPEALTVEDRLLAVQRGARVLFTLWVVPDGE
jgi:CHAT domain/AAA ATPase domain